jgi:ribosomal protein S18 acetylase RimI-like enzyme
MAGVVEIKRADEADLEPASILFARYREFYGQSFDLAAARSFLHERLSHDESIVFLAKMEGNYAGFAQLYPSFSSVGLKRIWILNDLFVAADDRQKGMGQALINKVIEYARETGRSKVVLSTACSNLNAQQLYEKLGFVKEDFLNYEYLV